MKFKVPSAHIEKLQFADLNTPQLFDAELFQNAKEAAKTKKGGEAQIDFSLRSSRWHLKRARHQSPKPTGFPNNFQQVGGYTSSGYGNKRATDRQGSQMVSLGSMTSNRSRLEEDREGTFTRKSYCS